MHPVSHYGAGKLASECYISSFVENYGLRAWVLRFGNVVGKRLTHGVIYDFVAKLGKDGSKLEVLGDGRQTKTYIDVEDCVDGILLARRKSPAGRNHAERFQVFNLSTEGTTSVREIAEETVSVVTGGKARINYGKSPVGWVGDVPRTSLSVEKIHALGWRPRLDSTAAVKKSIRDFHGWQR
jgi:UDP-glucose 4-epimerase